MKEEEPFAESIARYVDQKAQEGIRLKDVARDFKKDPSNLDALFIEARGMTVKQYIDARRMEKLVHTLHDETLTSHDVAKRMGFNNYDALAHYVRRLTGAAFTTLRAEVRRRKKQKARGRG